MKTKKEITIKENDFKPMCWFDIPSFYPEDYSNVILLTKHNDPVFKNVGELCEVDIEHFEENYVKFCYINF